MMKKLVSALLMLALLCVSAAAMAEFPLQITEDSQLSYRLMLGNGSCRVITTGTLNGNPCAATYYIGGGLDSYNYTFDCGCTVTFSPDGVINYDNVNHRFEENGPNFTWNAEKEAWVQYSGPDREIVASSTEHKFVESAHKAPYIQTETAKIPPLEIEGYAALKAKADSFAQTYSENLGYTSIHTQERRMDGVTYVMSLYYNDGMYALYANDKLVEVYAGNLFFNNYWNEEDCRMQGNAAVGTYTEGFYDWKTGKLFQYKFYSQDRSVCAVYSDKNVLLSYETWDAEGGWWGFFDNAWEYAADGNPNGDHVVKKNPPAKVLEKILHAPAPAEYTSACVTSESDLKPDEKGVPFILANPSAINNATINTVAEQTGERTTEFDIELLGADGKEVDLAAPSVTLTLGYPAGMPQKVAQNYEFAVIHEADDGTEEVMTTLTGNVALTANGPQVTATGFSPYTVVWGTKEELADLAAKAADSLSGTGSTASAAGSLPQTGDNSSLLVWAALLVVSSAAFFARKRSRA